MIVSIKFLFILLVLFQIKQFVADFLLQRTYMLKKVLPGWDFVIPLASHCAVHGVLTLLICLWARPEFWWLAFVDFSVHFVIDRFRSSPRFLGRFSDTRDARYWWILGADQMMHHLTHIGLIYILIFVG
jgi:hypothetical protein